MKPSILLSAALSLVGLVQALPQSSTGAGARLLPRDNGDRKTCIVPSAGDPKIDDVPAIHQAFAECGMGGKIVFEKGVTFAINSLLVMEGCVQCIIEWDGILKQTADIDLILETQTFFTFQNKSTNILLKGASGAWIHSPSHTGGIDGQGQVWWERNKNASDLDPGTLRRPMLFTVLGSDHVLIDGLSFVQSPDWTTMFWNSSYITLQNTFVSSLSNSTTLPKNTDGLDTYNVDHMLISNFTGIMGDDCLALKGNNTHITIRGASCTGSHGVSCGSFAQYAGILDYVKGVWISDLKFYGGENAIRIKVWPSTPGHGAAIISDVYYSNAEIYDVDTPIFIESCYQTKLAECIKYPSNSRLNNIHIDHVRGNSSGLKNSTIGDLRCPPSANCSIFLSDIDLQPGNGGEGVFLCDGLGVDPGVPCIKADAATPNLRRRAALGELGPGEVYWS